MKSLRQLLLSTFLLISCQSLSFSQQVIFKKMPGIEPSGQVPAITQDPKGIIWFISLDELNSYDGYTVTTYKHDELNPNSPQGFRPECLYADKEGIIWIGNFGGGLDKFDPATGIFKHYRHDPKDTNSIGHDIVTVIFEDRDGNFWIGTHGGLDKMDKRTGKFSHYVHKQNDSTSLSNDQVRAIYQDKEGTLWIGTGSPWINANSTAGEIGVVGEGGLNKMDIKTGKFVRYMHDPKNPRSLINNKVRAIFEDSRGKFWIGTAGDGLHIMDRRAGTFQRYLYDAKHPDQLSRGPLNKDVAYDHISFISEDISGAIWIGTAAGGISRYDPETRKTKHFMNDTLSGFTDYSPFGVFTSRDGLLWISTLNGNIFTVSPISLTIPHYTQKNGCFSFYLSNDSILWTGTTSGLIRKDLKTNTEKQIIGSGLIYHMAKDADGNLWVASFPGGLYQLDTRTEKLTHYAHTNGNSLVNDSVIAVFVDRRQNIWIGTAAGLDKFDPRTGAFVHYRHNPQDNGSLSGDVVFTIGDDKDGNIWAAVGGDSAQGLNKLDPRTGKFTHYLNGVFVYSILNHDGTLFAGGFEQFYRFDGSANNFSAVSDPVTGRALSAVAAVEDDQQNLWLSGNKGIVQLNLAKNECFMFGKNAGVDEKSFYIFSAYKGSSGQLFFGGEGGYYSFNPSELLKKAKAPEVLFTNFSLGRQIIKRSEHGPLKNELWRTSSISLNHDQNIFSFDFVPIDYNNPTGNRLLYKLENYDDEWRPATNPGKAYYFNVPAGKYILKVKAVSSLGVWSERDIAIVIAPPWWRSWWAYCIYGLLLLALAFSFHRYQKARVLKKEREKTRAKEFAQAKEIEKAYHELKTTQSQLVQQAKMASLGELTAGIAHEIQNPLNFVNNFSEVNNELVTELKTELAAGHTQQAIELANNIEGNQEKINYHGKRADAIVKSMLQHSRTSTGHKEPTDINALADEYLRLAYHGLRAKDKNFNAKFQAQLDNSVGKVNAVPQDMGRVMLNLINNAFYTVNEKAKQNIAGYEPTVTVVTKKLADKVELRVIDNGTGISQKNFEKIFQPFFTTKPAGEGTGLGLSLAYDVITKGHGGAMKVETKEGKGSEFIINLPAN